MNRRLERVNGLLREEISRVLTSELKDHRLSPLVSVTRVDASPDLRQAKVYVSVLGDTAEKRSTLKALKSASGFVRRSIRPHISLRSVPVVDFIIDETIEQGAEMLKLISKVSPGPDTAGESE